MMLVIDLRRLLLEITRSRVSSFGRSGVNASLQSLMQCEKMGNLSK